MPMHVFLNLYIMYMLIVQKCMIKIYYIYIHTRTTGVIIMQFQDSLKGKVIQHYLTF